MELTFPITFKALRVGDPTKPVSRGVSHCSPEASGWHHLGFWSTMRGCG